jgi:phage FluMu protein Com
MDKTATIDGAPVVDHEPRCWRCGKKLAEALSRPWRIRCVRCKAENAVA